MWNDARMCRQCVSTFERFGWLPHYRNCNHLVACHEGTLLAECDIGVSQIRLLTLTRGRAIQRQPGDDHVQLWLHRRRRPCAIGMAPDAQALFPPGDVPLLCFSGRNGLRTWTSSRDRFHSCAPPSGTPVPIQYVERGQSLRNVDADHLPGKSARRGDPRS